MEFKTDWCVYDVFVTTEELSSIFNHMKSLGEFRAREIEEFVRKTIILPNRSVAMRTVDRLLIKARKQGFIKFNRETSRWEFQDKGVRANALDTLQKLGQEFTRTCELNERIEELEAAMTAIRDLAIPPKGPPSRMKSKRERLTLIVNAVDDVLKGTDDEG